MDGASLKILLEAVDADKAKLGATRPLPRHSLASLREKLALEWTYHSNAIEGGGPRGEGDLSSRLWEPRRRMAERVAGHGIRGYINCGAPESCMRMPVPS